MKNELLIVIYIESIHNSLCNGVIWGTRRYMAGVAQPGESRSRETMIGVVDISDISLKMVSKVH